MTAAANSPTPTDVPRRVDWIVRPLTRVFNPFIIRVAGGRWVPMFSVLHHRGHKSGRMYVTAITAVPRGGFFWLALPFGKDAGWVRNILAAGECTVRYRATDYRLDEPAVLDAALVRSEMPPVTRVGMKLMGADKVLRMRPITR